MKAFHVAVVIGVSVASGRAQDQPEPTAQYQGLLAAYSTTSRAFRAAETDLQRQQAVEQLDEFPHQFLDLADRHPADPVALLALRQAVQAVISVDSLAQQSWEMNRDAFANGSQRDSASRIVELLLRDQIKSDRLGPICDRMRFGFRQEFEPFLTAALETNPYRDVQGMACLALAQLLRNQLLIADRVINRPEWITRYEAILGKEYFQAIRGTGRLAFEQRVEGLFDRATKFGDVINIRFSETVSDKAKTELFDMRYLSVGKLAPDIEGQDQEGRQFKLSEYRGKVVLLYFWLEY